VNEQLHNNQKLKKMKASIMAFMLFAVAFFASPVSSFAQQKKAPVIKSAYYGKGKSAILSPTGKEPWVADGVDFRPIDFLVGGYGTCMMSMMDRDAGKNGFNLSKARTEITSEFDNDNGRVGKINIKCFIQKGDYTAEQKKIMETAAKNCPIGNSLHPDIEKNIEFLYGVE